MDYTYGFRFITFQTVIFCFRKIEAKVYFLSLHFLRLPSLLPGDDLKKCCCAIKDCWATVLERQSSFSNTHKILMVGTQEHNYLSVNRRWCLEPQCDVPKDVMKNPKCNVCQSHAERVRDMKLRMCVKTCHNHGEVKCGSDVTSYCKKNCKDMAEYFKNRAYTNCERVRLR